MDKDCYYKNKYKVNLVEEDKDAETAAANLSVNVFGRWYLYILNSWTKFFVTKRDRHWPL